MPKSAGNDVVRRVPSRAELSDRSVERQEQRDIRYVGRTAVGADGFPLDDPMWDAVAGVLPPDPVVEQAASAYLGAESRLAGCRKRLREAVPPLARTTDPDEVERLALEAISVIALESASLKAHLAGAEDRDRAWAVLVAERGITNGLGERLDLPERIEELAPMPEAYREARQAVSRYVKVNGREGKVMDWSIEDPETVVVIFRGTGDEVRVPWSDCELVER